MNDPPLVDVHRIQWAASLFNLGAGPEGQDVLSTKLTSLLVPLRDRAYSLGEGTQMNAAREHYLAMAHACDYICCRVQDVLRRLDYTAWLHQQRLAIDDTSGTRLARFAELAVKDFHGDVASAMDAVAPLLLLGGSVKRPPVSKAGFSDIAGYDQSKAAPDYRSTIPPEVLRVVDATERWWPLAKRVRKHVVHREHNISCFAKATDGYLFQVYDRKHACLITDPLLLWPVGTNVVDFAPYSSFVLAELLTFLDELGAALGLHLELETEGPAVKMLGDFTVVVDRLGALRERCMKAEGFR